MFAHEQCDQRPEERPKSSPMIPQKFAQKVGKAFFLKKKVFSSLINQNYS